MPGLRITTKPRRVQLWQTLGLIFTGLCSWGYFVRNGSFAENNIQLPFLDFPIFVGELLLFACLVLWVLIRLKVRRERRWMEGVAGVYALFVLGKALLGYSQWGPLAFRNAALFYYPVFAVFGAWFYYPRFFSRWRATLLVIVLMFSLRVFHFFPYFLLTSGVLAWVLTFNVCDRRLARILQLFVLGLFPYQMLFTMSRTMVVGNMVAIAFAALAMLGIARLTRRQKWGIGLCVGGGVVVAALLFIDPHALQSMINFGRLQEYHRYFEADYQRKKKNPCLVHIPPVRLFTSQEEYEQVFQNKRSVKKKASFSFRRKADKPGPTKQPMESKSVRRPDAPYERGPEAAPFNGHPEPANDAISQPLAVSAEQSVARARMVDKRAVPAETRKRQEEPLSSSAVVVTAKADAGDLQDASEFQEVAAGATKGPLTEIAATRDGPPTEPEGPRNLQTAYMNVLFRLFIWNDMIDDLRARRPVLGMPFGRPLRSKRLEVLGLAKMSWGRDGWVASHNSYLNYLYRGGVAGMAVIAMLVWTFGRIIRRAWQRRMWTGILLSAALVSWLVAANFSLIFELPYTAIPFWTLLGMTYRVCFGRPFRMPAKSENIR